MKKLKLSHKNLMWFEAAYIYCLRNNINYDEFEDNLMNGNINFNAEEGVVFDKICKDLRGFRRFKNYELSEITEAEYEMCVDKFGCEK